MLCQCRWCAWDVGIAGGNHCELGKAITSCTFPLSSLSPWGGVAVWAGTRLAKIQHAPGDLHTVRRVKKGGSNCRVSSWFFQEPPPPPPIPPISYLPLPLHRELLAQRIHLFLGAISSQTRYLTATSTFAFALAHRNLMLSFVLVSGTFQAWTVVTKISCVLKSGGGVWKRITRKASS